jgi:hypothetical protein
MSRSYSSFPLLRLNGGSRAALRLLTGLWMYVVHSQSCIKLHHKVFKASLHRNCIKVWYDTEIRSPAEARNFSSNLCVQTGSGTHPASCTMGTGGSFPGVKRGWGVTLTTHRHLVPRSWMCRSYTSFFIFSDMMLSRQLTLINYRCLDDGDRDGLWNVCDF